VLELYNSEGLEVWEEGCVGEGEGEVFRVGSSGVRLEILTFGGAIRGVWGQPSEIRSAASGGVLSGSVADEPITSSSKNGDAESRDGGAFYTRPRRPGGDD
jgi:hypothetical protein